MASGTAQVKASSGLNVRKGAGTQYSKIGWLSNGTKINYQAEQNGWLKFNYNGKDGYVSKQYTSITSTSSSNNASSGATSSNANGSVKVTASSLNVRTGAGTSYKVLGTVKKNQVFSYSAESNGWYKINYNGKDGWISGKYATKTSSSGNTNTGNSNTGNTSTSTTTMYVTADSLNVRKGAGTGYGIIGSVKKGTAIAVRKTADGWHQINYGSGTGWVSGQYVSKTKPSSGSSNNNAGNSNSGNADTSAIPTQKQVRSNNSVYGHVDSAGSKLVTASIPYKMYYGSSTATVKVHKAVKSRVEAIFSQTAAAYTPAEIEELGLNKYSGCYNKRKTTGGSSYSIHSWGVAIDIDAGRNPMSSTGKEPLAREKAKKFWQIVEANGGHSMGRNFGYDWMHFQFAKF